MDTALECTFCVVPLATTHRVYVSPGGRTKRGECPKCRRVFTIVEVVVFENCERGQGAHAVAKKLKEGDLVVKLQDGPAK
jgi:hypothetical protein